MNTTPLQRKYLDAIRNFQDKEQIEKDERIKKLIAINEKSINSPIIQQLAKHFGVTKEGSRQVINALERKGLVKRVKTEGYSFKIFSTNKRKVMINEI